MFFPDNISATHIGIFLAIALFAYLADRLSGLTQRNSEVEKGWANIVAAALPMIMGAVQTGMAAKQNKNRPTYAIPEANRQALEEQKRLAAMKEAPGTGAMLNQIRQQGAAATQNVKEIGGGSAQSAGAVADIYAKELAALQGMQGNQEAFRVQQSQNLVSGLNNYGQLQNQAWDYNQNQPYQQSMAAKSALTNAAMSNMMGGAMGALGTVSANQQNQQMMDMYKQMYGGGSNGGVQMGSSTANMGNFTSQQGGSTPWYDPTQNYMNLPDGIGG